MTTEHKPTSDLIFLTPETSAIRWASSTQHLMRDLHWTVCGRPIPISGARTVERDEDLLCDQCRRGESRG